LKIGSLILIALLIFILPWSAFAGQNEDNTWSYSVKDNKEKSKRAYLLVYAPDKKERRVVVTSECERPYYAEGTYGTCTHKVSVQSPGGTNFKLNTGEDVVMVQFTYDAPLILATIEYGCCAGSDVARFYTEKGEYIGAIRGYGISTRANGNNVIERTFSMGNGTRYRDRILLLVQASEKDKDFKAWTYGPDGKSATVPVLLEIPNTEDCEDWHVDDFVAYGDRQDMTLKLKGVWCADRGGDREQYFSCTLSDKSVTCHPVEATKSKESGAMMIKDSIEK